MKSDSLLIVLKGKKAQLQYMFDYSLILKAKLLAEVSSLRRSPVSQR